jgi:2-dehydropantoate 2-reductase
MRIAIMGTGALGGFFGCRLAAAGLDVTFVARNRTLAALREHGIRLESPTLGRIAAPRVKATDDPGAVGPVDLVIFTVKAYQIEAAAEQIRPMIGRGTAVVPLLNGLEVVERLSAVLGGEPVMGGMSYVASAMPEPAVIRHFGNDGFTFGEPPGGGSARGEAIAAAMAKAGIPAELSRDIEKELWTKALMFCGTGGLLALCRKPFGELRADPDTRRVFEGALSEVEAVARAKGIALDPDVVAKACRVLDGFPPEGTSSMLRDVLAGRPLEVETVNGAVVRQARALGLAVPYNEAIYAGLKLLAGGQSA